VFMVWCLIKKIQGRHYILMPSIHSSKLVKILWTYSVVALPYVFCVTVGAACIDCQHRAVSGQMYIMSCLPLLCMITLCLTYCVGYGGVQ
jgi:hypothetical protein